ncbi:aromatic ring-opening dioxygenase LigA [Nocardioides sp. YIM 152315]|uniref:aromatic ring-opening dioxygenase LigA n=1 Tax=Nocardioides sp. YIM 152315 TaxID=3031760 RepID=UPI0023DAB158|nr:aromatic ring-opening dioxygenase LigA [Nocardioides sp. YIM 152315]MDF1605938.1 aromatic ring-opening dioxygenase LigA [Nocardioides sp. YIM 152315]
MAETDEAPATPPARAARKQRGVRLIGVIIGVLGLVFLVAGVGTYAVVSMTLADEDITVSDDADWFAGQEVRGPFTAYSQADIIAEHAEEIGGGKTYAELDQDDPNRATVMDASFLRASLYTSVVAFGVAVFVAVMGIVLMLLGWALVRLGRPAAT